MCKQFFFSPFFFSGLLLFLSKHIEVFRIYVMSLDDKYLISLVLLFIKWINKHGHDRMVIKTLTCKIDHTAKNQKAVIPQYP